MIKRLASIAALLLLLASGTPLLACMTDSAMSHQESACCRAMHGNCGDMAKTGCCQTSLRTDQHPQLVAIAPSIHVPWVTVDWPTPDFAATRTVPSFFLKIPAEHSPPGLLIARTTVLQI